MPVEFSQNLVEKRFSSPAAAQAAMDRAAALIAAGLSTPPPTRADHLTLHFPRLSGRSGPDLVANLPALLAPLRDLTRLRAPGLGLALHDPLSRIRPRLAFVTAGVATLAFRQIARLPFGSTTICHGDFHPGQIIQDDDGTCWLLDLDDLALGPAEADLGNLIAWLATRDADLNQPLAAVLTRWRAAVLADWQALGGRVDPSALDAYQTLAAIRRALKRAEAGDRRLLSALDGMA